MDTTTESEREHGCYECGSAEGTVLKLCPACRGANELERAQLRARITVDSTGVEDPFIYKVTNVDNANWLLVGALFATLVLGSMIATAVLGLAFSVAFLLLTTTISFGVVIVSQVALVREAFAYSRSVGLMVLVIFPLAPLLAFLPKERFSDPEILVSIKTTVGALIAGAFLLTSSLVAANVLGVKILQPTTYWRAAANFEKDTKPLPIIAHHFE